MLKKIRDKQEDKLGFVKDLFEDLNPISLGAKYYYVVFLLRRLFLVIIAVALADYNVIQIILIVLMSLGNLTFLLNEQVFKSRSAYRVEIINDFAVYLCGSFCLILLANMFESEKQESLDYSMFLVICLLLVYNVCVIVRELCRNCQLRAKRRYNKFTSKARLWDRKFNSHKRCQC